MGACLSKRRTRRAPGGPARLRVLRQYAALRESLCLTPAELLSLHTAFCDAAPNASGRLSAAGLCAFLRDDDQDVAGGSGSSSSGGSSGINSVSSGHAFTARAARVLCRVSTSPLAPPLQLPLPTLAQKGRPWAGGARAARRRNSASAELSRAFSGANSIPVWDGCTAIGGPGGAGRAGSGISFARFAVSVWSLCLRDRDALCHFVFATYDSRGRGELGAADLRHLVDEAEQSPALHTFARLARLGAGAGAGGMVGPSVEVPGMTLADFRAAAAALPGLLAPALALQHRLRERTLAVAAAWGAVARRRDAAAQRGLLDVRNIEMLARADDFAPRPGAGDVEGGGGPRGEGGEQSFLGAVSAAHARRRSSGCAILVATDNMTLVIERGRQQQRQQHQQQPATTTARSRAAARVAPSPVDGPRLNFATPPPPSAAAVVPRPRLGPRMRRRSVA